MNWRDDFNETYNRVSDEEEKLSAFLETLRSIEDEVEAGDLFFVELYRSLKQRIEKETNIKFEEEK